MARPARLFEPGPLRPRLLTEGPWSFHEQYTREGRGGLARTSAAPVIVEADLAGLPEPVQRYLPLTRAVGRPRVKSYRLRSEAGFAARLMPAGCFEAEQQSCAAEPTRLFMMRARMFWVPVEAFHRAVGDARPCRSQSRASSRSRTPVATR